MTNKARAGRAKHAPPASDEKKKRIVNFILALSAIRICGYANAVRKQNNRCPEVVGRCRL
jgi:hypothetical protein